MGFVCIVKSVVLYRPEVLTLRSALEKVHLKFEPLSTSLLCLTSCGHTHLETT